ncbi:dihydrolipoamide dehydrogenase [Neolewinella xylanilytica]|uniref:Dihydrolipoyl dehydrogenase n=1 Tax=Neolewinella xylanilytica TaxID=1514080 RepID=A0A2S6I2U0_9BACT|nr:dihydrolipoyl dehydrogenase [Neolewinella xylanilytica]PPK85460.1 dihydrolipoamide dehydrogenase [Neolewinella xylanilytica]
MNFDLTIIGSGPGGYVAAIRAAQLGMNVAIVERYDSLGGTCLNVGCIPSKALLDSSEHYHNAHDKFTEHGIDLSGLKVNMPQMIKRKNEVVDQTVKGVQFLMKKNKIEVFYGHGSFTGPKELAIAMNEGEDKTITSEHFIIATGSKPITPGMFNYDKKRVITSTEALNIAEVPKSMAIIGGGVIGLELGSVFGRLGTEVDVIELEDRILPTMDKDCSKELTRSLKKTGLNFYTSHKVTAVKGGDAGATLTFEKQSNGEATTKEYDYVLLAMGRRPYTDKLGLDKAGVEVDERGRVKVGDHLQTNVPHIYAIGDVVRGAMLAHKAEEEGIYAVEHIAGQQPHVDYNLIPGVVYTWPEVAAVGKTEEELKAAGIKYKAGKFPFKALGRARASTDLDGMVKVLADAETDEILGVHMVGARAADMISEAVALMEFRASAEDAARMSHAHPTYTEAFREAALAATGDRALHV